MTTFAVCYIGDSMDNRKVQEIAKSAMEYLETQIVPQITVRQIAALAEAYMVSAGVTGFWYYDIGAFVFAGEDTVCSVTGRDYVPSNRKIEENDIITVDLSPQYGDVWGDYARTFIIENGQVQKNAADIESLEFKDGILTENMLHRELVRIAKPSMTFAELYHVMNEYIVDVGYINLDLRGNLGHSIEKNRDDRVYIEYGNDMKLSEKAFFTFEPHIGKASSRYGFKMENIYCFENSQLIDVLL